MGEECASLVDIVTLSAMQVTNALREEVLKLINQAYGPVDEKQLELFFAPGRANLLGAHMDYNGGVVMPVALSRGTIMAVRPRSDRKLRMCSAQFGGELVELDLADLKVKRTKNWSAYAEGAIYCAEQAWGKLPGLDIAFCANLPMGRGLSSSASIECVVVFGLAHLLGINTDPDEIIRLAHRAENEYVGVRCGILDQAAISLAKPNTMLLMDCLEFTREHLPLPAGEASIAIVDSGVQRELGSTAFNQRVIECTQALAILQENLPGVTCLRDVTQQNFIDGKDRLSPILQRRVEHVVSEVERTNLGSRALRDGDLPSFGKCMTGAHESLRINYEVSTPELDCLVAAAVGVDGCYGARLTGAGFGGCIVALVHPSAQTQFSECVTKIYREQQGRETRVQWFQPAGGTTRL